MCEKTEIIIKSEAEVHQLFQDQWRWIGLFGEMFDGSEVLNPLTGTKKNFFPNEAFHFSG